jgi:hypothetical protein
MRSVAVVTLHINPDHVFDNVAVGYHAGSFDRLSSLVRMLVLNPETRERVARHGRQHALAFHSMKNARQLGDLIEKSASSRSQVEP